MVASPNDSDPAPAFPAWPFTCLILYTHMARDVGRYAETLSQGADPAEVAWAQGDLGLGLWRDLMQCYFDLAMAPFTAMTSGAAPTVVTAATSLTATTDAGPTV